MRIRAYFGLPFIATRPPISLFFGTVYLSSPIIMNFLAKLSRSYKDSAVLSLAVDVSCFSAEAE